MSEELKGVIIGGTFGFIGALLGNVISVWAENRRRRRENLHAIRLRLVGDCVQTSEIMAFIRSQQRRVWPRFWKKGYADLKRLFLCGVRNCGGWMRCRGISAQRIKGALDKR
jgi:hypothetical protein